MSRPSNRRGPGRVSVQVARQGGGEASGGEVPTRGRHRSPDAEGGPVLAASSPVGAPRHRRARSDTDEQAGPAGLPARSLARVEAAQDAASRPAVAVRPVPTTGGPGADSPARGGPAAPPTTPVAAAVVPGVGRVGGGTAESAEEAEEAVTDLVARPGRGALPDGPGTGPQPAVLGSVVSVVALVAAVVAAAVAGHGESRAVLVGVLVVALLGVGTAALGLGRQRPRRTVAAAGVVVGAAAALASVIPLLTH